MGAGSALDIMYFKDKSVRVCLRLNQRQADFVINQSDNFDMTSSQYIRSLIDWFINEFERTTEDESTKRLDKHNIIQ